MLLSLNGLEALYLTISELDKNFSSPSFDKFLEIKAKAIIPNLYSKYSGINTGYGFFAPNVKGTGFITIDSCGRDVRLRMDTYEGAVRLSTFHSNLLDDILKRKNDTKMDTFRNALYDLIYYQVTLDQLKNSSCIPDSTTISFHLDDIDRFGQFKQTGKANLSSSVVRRYHYEVGKK